MILTMHGISSLITSGGGGGGGGENVIGGREYRVVTMPDGKVWMAENLDYKFDGCSIGNMTTDSSIAQAAYYDEDEATYGVTGNKYGLLYNARAARILDANRDTLCPGWHLPSKAEFDALKTACGGNINSGTKLKSTSGWSTTNGTDDYGFTAVPAGIWDKSFKNLGKYVYFWATAANASAHYVAYLSDTSSSMFTTDLVMYLGFSIRLVKDD